jgi:transmembrane sensor
VSARVLDAAIAWQLCLDCGNGSAVEQAEFAKWYAASEEHARAWLQLGMLDQRFSTASVPARNACSRPVKAPGNGCASSAAAWPVCAGGRA